MSVGDETWDRPTCQFCKKIIPYGQKRLHWHGICRADMYAIGEEADNGGVGMCHGPSRKEDILRIPGENSAYRVYRLDKELGPVETHRWIMDKWVPSDLPYSESDVQDWSKAVSERILQEVNRTFGLQRVSSEWIVETSNDGVLTFNIRVKPSEPCKHDAGHELNEIGMWLCTKCRADITPPAIDRD